MNAPAELADYALARAAFVASIEAQGLIVTYPAANELQIDIDSDADMVRHERSWSVLVSNILHEPCVIPPVLTEEHRRITASRSGTGKHVRITLPFTLDPLERIAYQAALGSDPVRELLSLFRLRRGDLNPSLLVETPEVAATLASPTEAATATSDAAVLINQIQSA